MVFNIDGMLFKFFMNFLNIEKKNLEFFFNFSSFLRVLCYFQHKKKIGVEKKNSGEGGVKKIYSHFI